MVRILRPVLFLVLVLIQVILASSAEELQEMVNCMHEALKEKGMKVNVDALDLLAPITGEIVGGSLREHNYDKLKSKLPSDKLHWYLELRKFGNIPTDGYGLGLERLLQTMCRVTNIKDTLPFPRWPHNCSM